MTTPWIFVDFDNTIMGTEALAIPPLVARFNEIYGDKIPKPLTLDEFFRNFQGIAREALCVAMSKYYNIHIDYAIWFAGREESVTSHYRNVGVPMADNVIEAFNTVSDHGARFGIATNNFIQRCLSAMRFASNDRGEELMSFFGTHLFEAGDKQKPDPDVYLRAINFSGADRQLACAVEDSPTGARAALAAGLKTFGFVGYADHPDERTQELLNLGVTACFKDWAEFPALWLAHVGQAPKKSAA